jgi:uncharacterized repeat protein (TIGR02543 family)
LFDGWYTKKNGEGTKVPATISVSADTTYYAKWVPVPSGWEYDKETGGMYKTFGYLSTTSDHIQSFTIPFEGSYTFELLGAAGGKGYNAAYSGGSGGKSKGTITNLPKTTILYVYVGGKGGDGTSSSGGAGGWNGGGAGGWNGGGSGGGGGGGATDIRFGTALNTRVIVAGGGGGSSGGYISYIIVGGNGGGNDGGNGGGDNFGGSSGGGSGGGSSSGGNGGYYGGSYYSAGGGVGGDYGSGGSGKNKNSGGGGGGGYYGGGGGGDGGGGGGGSGFVYGFNGTQGNQFGSTAIPEGYRAYQFTDGSSTQGAGSSDDGSATVTYTPTP